MITEPVGVELPAAFAEKDYALFNLVGIECFPPSFNSLQLGVDVDYTAMHWKVLFYLSYLVPMGELGQVLLLPFRKREDGLPRVSEPQTAVADLELEPRLPAFNLWSRNKQDYL